MGRALCTNYTTFPPIPYPVPRPIAEMMTLLHYQMEVADLTTGLSAPPTMLCLDLCTNNPATSSQSSSFNYDRESGRFPHEWSNLAKFETWHQVKELTYSIELISGSIWKGKNGLWTLKRDYICSYGNSGGQNKYQKKHPERQQKIGSKKMDCPCKIIIRFYPHTPIIWGRYENDHNHEVGLANITFTRMSHNAWEYIEKMLWQKIDPREIVCNEPCTYQPG
jgi:hypothetical protein